jgi:hypothetical protein
MTGSQFRAVYRLAAEKIGRPQRSGRFTVFHKMYNDGSSIHLYISQNIISLSIRLHEDDERNKNCVCIEPYRCGKEDLEMIIRIISER